MKRFFSLLGMFIQGFWKLLTTGSILAANLFFLFVIIVIVSFFIPAHIEVPEGSALVLAPAGDLVEKKTVIDPVSGFINGFAGIPLPEETLLQDILDVVNAAAEDDRIKVIVLDLDELDRGSLNQLQTIGNSLNAFRQTGKKILAFGDQFDQGQYYLASFADDIYMNPMGSVNLWGFGVFRLYAKELIDRLSINFHVFKVGSFKSALEPLTRNDMSPEARTANREWLSRVWDLFCLDIAGNRNLTPGSITDFINNMPKHLRLSGGDSAGMAIANNLVDGLMTRDEAEKHLVNLVGKSGDDASFNQIHFLDYLKTLTPSYSDTPNNKKKIGIIVARGNIVYGEDVPGQLNSDDLSLLIRQARNDAAIRSVVLRIDSGGGSAFASEQIRQELLLLQRSGKPLVISMGALAASGAYWISADADRIFASPFTLTGSIGIYGMIPTFENTIAKIGVTSDGIGTTRIAAAGDPTQALPPELSQAIQLSVEEGYTRFLNIVATGRDMELEEVEKAARGRVWDGARAKDLGLVDELGGLEDSIKAAASLAGLREYKATYLKHKVYPASDLFNNFRWWSKNTFSELQQIFFRESGFFQNIRPQLDVLMLRGDPANIYAHSMLTPGLFSF